MSELSEPFPPLGAVAIARAVLISFVLAISLLQAVPGKPLRADELALPEKAEAIARVQRALAALGVLISSEAITEGVLTCSKYGDRARRSVLDAVTPVFDQLGMRQRWGLFTSRGQRAFQMQIEAMHADQHWHPVYRAHELDVLGLAPRLTFRRLRGIYDPRNKEDPKAQYDTFVSWLAAELLAEHPDFIGVRISMERVRLGSRLQPTEVTSVEHAREIYRPGTP